MVVTSMVLLVLGDAEDYGCGEEEEEEEAKES